MPPAGTRRVYPICRNHHGRLTVVASSGSAPAVGLDFQKFFISITKSFSGVQGAVFQKSPLGSGFFGLFNFGIDNFGFHFFGGGFRFFCGRMIFLFISGFSEVFFT